MRYGLISCVLLQAAGHELKHKTAMSDESRPTYMITYLSVCVADCVIYSDALADYLNSKKTNHMYLQVVSEAVELASWWIRHSVPYGLLKEKQIAVDGKTTSLILPVVTRWGSHYAAIKQLLKTETVMKLLALEKKADLIKSVGQKKPAKDKAEKMLQLCGDSNFWNTLQRVLEHLGPLLVSLHVPVSALQLNAACLTLPCNALLQIAVRTVESDQTRLDQVVKMLGYLHQHFSGVADAEVKRVMLAGLEMRFADYDQPPLVFSYILNPHRHMAFLNPECPLVQWRNLVKLVEVLYHRFFPEAKENTGIADQFIQYLNQEGPFDAGAQLRLTLLECPVPSKLFMSSCIA